MCLVKPEAWGNHKGENVQSVPARLVLNTACALFSCALVVYQYTPTTYLRH